MYDCLGSSLDRLKCLADNVLSGLCQHLDRDVVRDHVSLDQRAEEIIFRLGRCREADLDLFKTDLDQHLEELDLFFKTHGLDQGLIAVAQVDTAPDRGLLDVILLSPIQALRRGKEVLPHVFPVVHHDRFSSRFPAFFKERQVYICSIRFKNYQKP